MNKLIIYVPFTNGRDEVVSHFANNGVTYHFDIMSRISEKTLRWDIADQAIYNTARGTALAVIDSLGGGDILEEDGAAYVLVDESERQLGYEAVFYVSAPGDYFPNACGCYDADCDC